MIVNYYGHACFKLKGSNGTVVADPYKPYVGFELPNLSADIITVSHDNPAHNNHQAISGTARRNNPFLIDKPGEYEVLGISVFGVNSSINGGEKVAPEENCVFTALIDGLKVCHLGSLSHLLDEKAVAEIGLVDILFLPVGNYLSLDENKAIKVARSLEPNIVIPMSYKLPEHEEKVFADMKPLDDFLKAFETETQPIDKLNISRSNLPEEMELVILDQS